MADQTPWTTEQWCQMYEEQDRRRGRETAEEAKAREERQDALIREGWLKNKQRLYSWSPTPAMYCFVRAEYYSCLHVKSRWKGRSEHCPRCPPDGAVFLDENAKGCDPPAISRSKSYEPCPNCKIKWDPVKPGTEEYRQWLRDTPLDHEEQGRRAAAERYAELRRQAEATSSGRGLRYSSNTPELADSEVERIRRTVARRGSYERLRSARQSSPEDN